MSVNYYPLYRFTSASTFPTVLADILKLLFTDTLNSAKVLLKQKTAVSFVFLSHHYL